VPVSEFAAHPSSHVGIAAGGIRRLAPRAASPIARGAARAPRHTARCAVRRAGPVGLVVALAAFSAGASAQSTVPQRVVAYTDKLATGTSGALFANLFRPSISRGGEVGFRADLKLGDTHSGNNEGIWVETYQSMSGLFDLQLHARESAPTPVAGFTYASARDPNVDAIGHVGAPWNVIETSSGMAYGSLWAQQPDGSVHLVARQGEAAPGIADAFFGIPTSNTLYPQSVIYNDLGQTLFHTTLTGSGVIAANDQTLWFDGGTGPILIAREGSKPPGPAAIEAYTALTGDMVLSPTGRFAFLATVRVLENGTPFSRQALFSNHSGAVDLVAVERQPITGLGADERIAQLTLLRMNASGQMAWRGTIVNTFGSQLGLGIWITDTLGNPSLVLRSPGNAGPSFGFVSDERWLLTDAGRVVFVGEDVVPVPFSSTTTIFQVGPGVLGRLANEGQPAPELGPGVVFADFEQLAANASGAVAFRALVSGAGVTTANDRGLWMRDGTLGLRLIEREGNPLTVATGITRTIATLVLTGGSGGSDGRQRGFSDQPPSVVWLAGTGGATAAIVVSSAAPPPPQPKLLGLEVVQSVQNWKNTIRLFAGKRTFVRAHLASNPSIPFQGALRGFRDGMELSGSPLYPANPGEIVKLPVAVGPLSRSELAASPYFELPAHWTSGDVTFELVWLDGNLDCLETAGPVAGDCKATVTFWIPEGQLELKLYSIDWTAGGVTRTVTPALREDVVQRMIAMYPVVDVDRQMAELEWTGDVPPASEDVMDHMEAVRLREKCTPGTVCKRIYYGAILSRSVQGALGIAFKPGKAGAGRVRPSPREPYRHVMGHEVVHSLGHSHSVHLDLDLDGSADLAADGSKQGVCGEVAPRTFPDFPNWYDVGSAGSPLFRPTLGPLDQGADSLVHAFDSDLMEVGSPYLLFDLMSYCERAPIGTWPADVTYQFLWLAISFQYSFDAAASSGNVPIGDHLLVRGRASLAADSGELAPLTVLLDSPPASPLPVGSTSLRFEDSGGELIQEVFFEPAEVEVLGEDPGIASFTVSVPVDPAIRRVELWRGGVQLTSRVASANPPAVTVLAPNGGETLATDTVVLEWDGADVDGDPLFYDVLYSPDGGATWHALAIDHPSETLEVRRSSLPASTNGVLRVHVSDGFDSAYDDSNAPFTVADNPPAAFIARPFDGQVFVGGQTITFLATGVDPDVGQLGDAALQWSSSVSGLLGSGKSLSVPANLLASGPHTITLTATSGVLTGTDTVDIVVYRSAPGPLADARVAAVAEPESVFAGAPLVFVFEVSNDGPEGASELTFDASFTQGSELLPVLEASTLTGDVPVLDVDAPGWSCTTGLGTVSCTRDALDVLASSTLEVEVSSATEGMVTAAATVTIAEIDPQPVNDAIEASAAVLAAQPDIAVVPDPVDFDQAPIGNVAHRAAAVENRGTQDLYISTVTDPGSTDFELTLDACSDQTLAPGAFCAIEVSFSPLVTSFYFSELMIDSDDPDTPTFLVGLVGEGVEGVEGCTAGEQVTVSEVTLTGDEILEACVQLTVGPDVDLTATADVVFRAGAAVRIEGPFSVASGARLRVEIDPLLAQ
jgi:hypothetical protein